MNQAQTYAYKNPLGGSEGGIKLFMLASKALTTMHVRFFSLMSPPFFFPLRVSRFVM